MRMKILLLMAVFIILGQPAAGQQTNIFTIYGNVYGSDGVTLIEDGHSVRVVNQTQDDTLTAFVGEGSSGTYNVVFVDFNDNCAAAVGDSIVFVLYTAEGYRRSNEMVVGITGDYISGKQMRFDLVAPALGVILNAPVGDLCYPGQNCASTFTVMNSGEVEDVYHIDVSVSDPGWLSSFPDSVGPIAPGGNALIEVVLYIPVSVTWPVQEQITVTACSRLDGSVCMSEETYRAIPTMVQNSWVSFSADHIEVSWRLTSEALTFQRELLRSISPSQNYEELKNANIEYTGDRFYYRDYDVQSGQRYNYVLRIHGAEIHEYPLGAAEVPHRNVLLHQNYPNPFRPGTTIQFDIPEESKISLRIFDVNGRLIKILIDNEVVRADSYKYEWDGRNDKDQLIGSGIYFYQLTTMRQTLMKKMMLLR
jgi:hypothetical protein